MPTVIKGVTWIAIVTAGVVAAAPFAMADNPPPSAQPASVDLVATVKTTETREALSQFLIIDAQKAEKDRKWGLAIPYYQALVAARGPASAEAAHLARLWTLAGQSEDAAAVWTTFASSSIDEKARREALSEVTRLTANPDPFADRLELIAMAVPAKKAFTLGRKAFAAKRFGDALVYFHMGYSLAPDLPGFLRELGATYDKLGAPEKKQEFYRRYLLARPFGGNADIVRRELGNAKQSLGTLLVSTSLPCQQLWINRQRVIGKLPASGLLVAPGTYKGLCFAPNYEMALFEYATVEAGKPARLEFAWAIVVNKLTNPFGRISLENPKSPGVMIDLGISNSEIGVAVPTDRRALNMEVKDDIGSRVEKRTVKLEAGQRTVVSW
jgi:tetratricopeptide (TPR) repeat protein